MNCTVLGICCNYNQLLYLVKFISHQKHSPIFRCPGTEPPVESMYYKFYCNFMITTAAIDYFRGVSFSVSVVSSCKQCLLLSTGMLPRFAANAAPADEMKINQAYYMNRGMNTQTWVIPFMILFFVVSP